MKLPIFLPQLVCIIMKINSLAFYINYTRKFSLGDVVNESLFVEKLKSQQSRLNYKVIGTIIQFYSICSTARIKLHNYAVTL